MNTIQTLEYEVNGDNDLIILLQTLICMGLNDQGPIPSFSYDLYRKTFKVRASTGQLNKWLDILNRNQISAHPCQESDSD